MNSRPIRLFLAAMAGLLIISMVIAITGCGESKPTFMSFTGKDKESAKKMKPIIDKFKKDYKDQVIFKDIDMEDPENKKLVEEYHVTMDPTYVILNTEGKVRETFMGAAHEEMLVRAIQGVIPSKTTTPSSATTAPQSVPFPTTAPPSPVPMPTVPVTPSK